MIASQNALAGIIVFALLTIPSLCHGQTEPAAKENRAKSVDSLTDSHGDTLKGTADEKIVKFNSAPVNKENQIKSIDSTKFNMFGYLSNDDTAYNKKSPLWIPVVGIIGTNVATNLVDRYILNLDFSRVSFTSWGRTLQAGWPWGSGWKWDQDRFGNNFLLHPYSGSLFFNSARASGYDFWESAPYTLLGSYMWKIFGENGTPEREDLINTTFTGVFLGEVLYRLSSNLLDDRTTGTERFFRELGGAAIDPERFFYRLFQGKLNRVTTKEVYQEEPLNIELSAGMRVENHENNFGTGPLNALVNVQLDYGYPWEKRELKPYDFFTLHTGINLGVGRKFLENLIGYGILYGKHVQPGDLEMVWGLFQHYDYFDNKSFELGTIALGGGIMSKYPVSKDAYILANFHLGVVPFGGNSTQLGPDTSQFRDYNFCGGMETKLEAGLNLDWASVQLNGYYYWLNTYVGTPGNNFVGIIRPRITIKLIKNLNLGFEELAYITDRYTSDFGNFHAVRTEQRLYLMLNGGNLKL